MSFNILIVDDSSVMRAMIARTLALSGLPIGEVHQAGDGAAGLAMIREHWIDLALVDLNMPVLGGEDMIDRLRQDPDGTRLPIIVVSSDASTVRHERLAAKGIGFVQKPFAPEQLRDLVLNTLGMTYDGCLVHGTPATSDQGDF